MKKSLLVVFIILFSTFVFLPSWADSNLLGQPSVPQEYHQAGAAPTTQPTDDASADSTQQSQTQAVDTGSDAVPSDDDEAAQMAHVKEIEAQAKQQQQNKQMQSSQVSTAVPATPVMGSVSTSGFQSLQAEIVRLGQMSTSAQQQLSDRINGLSQQYKLLEQKTVSLIKVMQQLQQSVVALQPAASNVTAPVQPPADQGGVSSVGHLVWWLVLLSVLVVLLLIANVYLLRQLKQQAVHSTADSTDDEYDFMATEEAIPAKLDLARAYIRMSDNEQAVAVLEEVLNSGDDVSAAEAQELLTSLSEKKEDSSNDG